MNALRFARLSSLRALFLSCLVSAIARAETPAFPHDFDFLMGSWTVHHHRLSHWLAGNHDWYDFKGTCTAQKILGGMGNMDDNVLEKPSGTYRAVSLRAYDTTRQSWSIWWLDGRTPDAIDVPVVGTFTDGVGTFICDSTWQGKPVKVRFVWSRTDTASPHWEQAFSTDGGATWEINWVMDFTRAS